MVSLPTTMPMTLLLRRARLMADSISRSLRSAFLSIQAPTVTFRPNSAAIGGTSSMPSVEEYRRTARVSVASFFRSARTFSESAATSATVWPGSNGA